ncbi:hypothetical protein [Methanosarcina barkeri]
MTVEDFDKPLISTYYLYTLYKQLAKNLGLSKSSVINKLLTINSY